MAEKPQRAPLLLHGPAIHAACVFLVAALPAKGQFLERPVVIRNARMVTMAGPEIKRGSIMIKGGRIEALGPRVKSPFLAQTIDATDRAITPGLIDSWCALGHLGASAWDAKTGDSLWRKVKKKSVLDFSKWKTKAFEAEFAKLLKGLKVYYPPKGEPAEDAT